MDWNVIIEAADGLALARRALEAVAVRWDQPGYFNDPEDIAAMRGVHACLARLKGGA